MKARHLLTTAVMLCLAVLTLPSCDELEDMDGMNESNSYYSYTPVSHHLDYSEATVYFVSAIREAVGSEPILGGDDDKVIKACNACYESLKTKLKRSNGVIEIMKTRHPDGKQKRIKKYKF